MKIKRARVSVDNAHRCTYDGISYIQGQFTKKLAISDIPVTINIHVTVNSHEWVGLPVVR
jgi:hypothetical protein